MERNNKILPKVFGILVIIFLVLILLGIFQMIWLNNYTLYNKEGNNRDPTIIINGNQGWEDLAANKSWCYGSGNWSDPYIIENITIDIKKEWANCMVIRNTDAFFIVRNCEFLQTSCCYPFWCFCGIRYGIKLENVTNGKFINNTLFFHDYGIHMENCSNLTISYNNFTQSHYGIQLYSCFNNTIVENHFNNQINESPMGIGVDVFEASSSYDYMYFFDFHGIYMENCSDLTVSNNIFTLIDYGIKLVSSFNNIINGNRFNNQKNKSPIGIGFGIFEAPSSYDNIFLNNSINFAGIYISNRSNYVDTSNLVNRKPIYIYRNLVNLVPKNFSNAGFVILENCNNVRIDNISIQSTVLGLLLTYCSNISITNSSFKYSWHLLIKNSINITITNSNFDYEDLIFKNCKNSIISNNALLSSELYLSSSDENLISFNFFNSTHTAIYLNDGSDNNLALNNTIYYSYSCFYNSSDCVGNQWINNTCIKI